MAAELRIAQDLSLPLDVLTEAVGIIATRGAGKTYGSVVLIEEAHAVGVPFVVIDPTGVYHGLRSSADGKRDGLPVYVIGGPHGDLPLEPASGAFLAGVVVDSGHSFVFDLSDLSKTKARSWVAAFLERLYERKARARTTLLLVVDEADEFAPQKATGASATVLGAMEQVVKRGRSRGIGCVLISQRTQAINKDVLDLIDTLIALRVIAPRGRKAIADWVVAKEAEDEKGVVASLNSLTTGRAWLWSPVRGVLEQFTFRRIRTFDSYATPRPGETRDEPSRRKELDLDALGEQMQATIKRAKENDPAELRRRVREMERQLETADTPRARDEAFGRIKADLEQEIANLRAREAERIEVPAIEETQLADLRYLVASLRASNESHIEALTEVTAALGVAIAPLASALTDIASVHDRMASLNEPARTPPAAATNIRPRPLSSSPNPTDRKLGVAAIGFLHVLARFYPMPLTIGQLGMLAKRKTRGGSFNTAIRELRDGGYIQDAPGGEVAVTEDGLAEAGVTPRAMTIDDWREVLPVASREILDQLRSVGEATVDEVAAATGRAPRGGSWNTAMKMLLQTGLVERVGNRLRLL